MIILRTWGVDNNAAGNSPFVSIPVPTGTLDGDLAVVSIALEAYADVLPPDNSWTRVVGTDLSQFGIAVFYAFVFNAPARWTFSLIVASTGAPNSTLGTGSVQIYKGVDSFFPVEVAIGSNNGASANIPIPAVATSIPNEEMLVIVASPASAGFTPSGTYAAINTKANGASLEIATFHKTAPSAGAVATTNFTNLNAGVVAASAIVVLRPSQSRVSVDDVRRRIVGALPQGVDEVYDLTTGGDYYRFFQSIAEVFKTLAFDLIEILRSEIIPSRSWYKLPGWERIFGLTTSKTALLGSVPQRQAQVQASWRAAAKQGSSEPEVQAALAPLLGYFPTTHPQILHCSRTALTTKNSYSLGTATMAAPSSTNITVQVSYDGGIVSSAGPRLVLNLSPGADMTQVTFLLYAPSGAYQAWSVAVGTLPQIPVSPFTLYANKLAGTPIQGSWLFGVVNGAAGVTQNLLTGSSLFVEGILAGSNTGAAIFHWGVYADPAHVGENGTPADINSAQAMLQRMRPAHSVANICLNLQAVPGTASIPGRCLPV